MFPVKLAEFKFVNPPPSPAKELAVIAPAAKLPDPSRITMVPGVFVLVAEMAALAAPATFAADCPPTLETTVAPCVPTTSPESEPEKLLAVVAVVALPFKLPLKPP